jgi:hypothetical protein
MVTLKCLIGVSGQVRSDHQLAEGFGEQLTAAWPRHRNHDLAKGLLVGDWLAAVLRRWALLGGNRIRREPRTGPRTAAAEAAAAAAAATPRHAPRSLACQHRRHGGLQVTMVCQAQGRCEGRKLSRRDASHRCRRVHVHRTVRRVQ